MQPIKDRDYVDKEHFIKLENVTIIYRLWTLKDGTLDEKSTSIVDKITQYYKLSPEIVDKIKKEKNIKIKDSIYVDKDNEFDWPSISSHNSCGFCYALKTHIAILVDGTVVPCCLDSEGILRLGNIFEEEISAILNSERALNIVEGFKRGIASEDLCKRCGYAQRFVAE